MKGKYFTGTFSDQGSEPKISSAIRVNRPIVIEFITFLLVLLFMYTAISKLIDYRIFRTQLSKSPFLTDFAGILYWILPVAEILIAVALTIKKTRLFGLYCSLFLMTSFTVYIYAMLNFSYDLPCSCGGVISKMDWNTHLWFNITYTLLALSGILFSIKRT